MKIYLLSLLSLLSLAAYSQHAPGYVLSASEYQSWDGNTNAWVPSLKSFFNYHLADTLFYNTISKQWDTVTHAYDINQYQNNYTYTSAGKQQLVVEQQWNTVQTNWRNLDQNIYSYDNNNNNTNFVRQNWDTVNSVWVNSNQTISVYNNNNLTQYLQQTWNADSNNWRNSSLQNLNYDNTNHLIQNILQNWNTTNYQWTNSKRNLYQYTFNPDTTQEIFQDWNTSNNTWVNNEKYITTFNSLGNATFFFALNWNINTLQWDSTDVETYTYNSNNQLISDIAGRIGYGNGTAFFIMYDSLGNGIQFLSQANFYNGSTIFFTLNISKIIDTYMLISGALPIVLTDFNGQKINTSSQLKWHIATQTGNDYFEIERSTDHNKFTYIGKILAPANLPLTHDYIFIDNTPQLNAVNYYRLKMVDKDGNFSYSKIVALNFNHKQFIQIFPNPTKDYVLINLESGSAGNYTVRLTDVNGRILSAKIYSISSGAQSINVSLNKYSKGIYFIEVKDPMNNVITQKEIIKE